MWRLRTGSRGRWWSQGRVQFTPEVGFCDMSAKTIWVNCAPMQWKETLIHEMCHAVTRPGHGPPWLRRMRAAGGRAGQLGDQCLSTVLLTEADVYEATPKLTARMVYGSIEDVLMDLPTATWEDIVEHIAYEYCLTGPELLTKYPRLPRAYAAAARRHMAALRGELSARKRFMALSGDPETMQRLEATIQAMEAQA